MPDTRRTASRVVALVAGLALACTALSTDDPDQVVIFTGLPPSDTVRAQIVLDGEWGDSAYELVFRGGNEHLVSVVKLTGEWSEKTRKFTTHRRSAPVEANLSGGQLWGLNELLHYYREGPPETCNDTEIITLERVRGGKTVASEHFVDKSCGARNVKGVTTLWDVIDRAEIPR